MRDPMSTKKTQEVRSEDEYECKDADEDQIGKWRNSSLLKKRFSSMGLKNRFLIKTAQLTHLLSFMITEFMKAE